MQCRRYAAGLVLTAAIVLASGTAQAESRACARVPGAGEAVNAMRTKGGLVLPLYRARNGVRVAFRQQGADISALAPDGSERWRRPLGAGTLFGGFDLDGDGHPDFGLAKARSLARSCGQSVVHESWLDLYSGRDGRRLAATSALEDVCHTNLNYATRQWTANTLLFGGRPGVVAVAPQYAESGWMLRWVNRKVQQETYLYPSTAAFTRTYARASQLTAENGRGQPSYIPRSHVQNGLIVAGRTRADDRLTFFTSARVLQYAIAPLSPNQLVGDRVFRSDSIVSGRNYGLVQADPQAPTRVALIAGAGADSLWRDLRAGRIGADPLGGIERHVSLYDLTANKVWQRFYSSASSAVTGSGTRDRVVYPARALLPTAFAASAIAFNVYTGTNWVLHITQQGSTRDAARIANLFVWDVLDLDDDGTPELVASPVDAAPGSYFPRREVHVYGWNPRNGKLTLRQRIERATPHLVAAFKQPDVSSSSGSLHPILVGEQEASVGIYVIDGSGRVRHEALCMSRVAG
ncbi:MAG: hypothetical protein GC150_12170 [Rhizobiales bacterium]|nr:hypothetical protein [Hyphomicrobiales bacterium]